MLTKDPNETKSLEYVVITNYTVSWIYYADNCFCVLKDQHTLTELCKKYCKKKGRNKVDVYMCSLKLK